MEKKTGRIRIWLGALFALLALGAAAGALWLFQKAPEMDVAVAEGPGSPGDVTVRFMDALAQRDWESAAALTEAGGPLGLEAVPEDESAAALWEAQLSAWSYALEEGYEPRGEALVRTVTVRAPAFSRAEEDLRAGIQARLEQAVESAALKSQVYESDGSFRASLVFECLGEALAQVAAAPERYMEESRVTLSLVWREGAWRVLPDGAWLEAMTGGAVRAVGPGEPEQTAGAYERFVNNLTAASLEGLVAVPKVYALAENTVVAPRPDPEGYGVSRQGEDTAPVMAASALLEGKELLWSPERETLPGREIRWYSDETIFAVSWRENINRLPFTLCEVVVAHPSQLRRYLADNSALSFARYRPTQMAETVNAVVALSGDFYKYRSLGIVVYQRELYRADGERLDTCFVNTAGDLLLVHHGELTSEKEIREYIRENDVLFSLSFGPIMIENGENVMPQEFYPVGQPKDVYSRCVLCQLGEGHYLLCTVNGPGDDTGTLYAVADALMTLQVPTAYALDGGQTASLIMDNTLLNPVDWGEERTMSDIIYFATALPEEEG